jgi:putative nucleotidyltransferase with HDIG domain
VVDDDPSLRQLLSRWFSSKGSEPTVASGGYGALEQLRQQAFDLVLLDIQMPDLDGISALPQIRELAGDTPVIMVSSLDALDTVRGSIRSGAYDYIVKPFDFQELEAAASRALDHRRLVRENQRYREHLEKRVAERTQELEEALEQIHKVYETTILALGSALETRDVETEAHSIRVARYTLMIVKHLGVIDEGRLKDIEWGAYLHDIGKIGVPDHILMKNGPLSEEEWQVMRRHPEIGRQLVSRIDFLSGAVPLIYSHHERWDGTGYPRRLAGEDIPLEARAFAIADTVDALTSDRPYRAGRPLEEVLPILREGRGKQFCPTALEAFESLGLEAFREVTDEHEFR